MDQQGRRAFDIRRCRRVHDQKPDKRRLFRCCEIWRLADIERSAGLPDGYNRQRGGPPLRAHIHHPHGVSGGAVHNRQQTRAASRRRHVQGSASRQQRLHLEREVVVGKQPRRLPWKAYVLPQQRNHSCCQPRCDRARRQRAQHHHHRDGGQHAQQPAFARPHLRRFAQLRPSPFGGDHLHARPLRR